MNKTYMKPEMKAAEIDAELLLSESAQMSYSVEEKASHNVDEEVLIKGNSVWDTEW